ncbi:hypothetical protein MKX01_036424 [Papaver californicum]|nr:hypothetical protein MKX01_036424 [Papaver californicum]
MMYNDDEPILKQNTIEEEADLELGDGQAEARIINKQEASMEESHFKVLLEVNGVGSDEGRLGVDLVTILDIGDTMTGFQIARAKLAIQFLLQKLSHVDRLSIVTFNKEADKLCPMRQITESSRMEIAKQVNALEAESSTNCIIIAAKSDGGIFALVPDLVPLSAVFSTSLAGLLDVVMEDLTLTITPENGSKITEVITVNYHHQTKGGETDPVTVAFGSLCKRETCRVLLKLAISKVDKRCSTKIFKIRYKFRISGEETYMSDERTINVTRNAISGEDEIEEVLAVERRIRSTYNIQGSGFALALEASDESQRSVALPADIRFDIPLMGVYKEQAEAHAVDPENYIMSTPEEDRVMEVSPIPETPKQEGWRLGRIKKAVDMGYKIANKLKEHDPRAAYTGKKIKALSSTS